jgi:hypothetical protein
MKGASSFRYGLSVRQHISALLPLDGFSFCFVVRNIPKFVDILHSCLEPGKVSGTSEGDLNVFHVEGSDTGSATIMATGL